MPAQLTVVSSNRSGAERKILLPEEKFKHFRNVIGAVLEDAQDTWGELWDEFQGEATDGVMVLAKVEEGFKPQCGWPEFLEKMWLLKHYLDHAKRFSEGKI
jgi:hypothetical protein